MVVLYKSHYCYYYFSEAVVTRHVKSRERLLLHTLICSGFGTVCEQYFLSAVQYTKSLMLLVNVTAIFVLESNDWFSAGLHCFSQKIPGVVCWHASVSLT